MMKKGILVMVICLFLVGVFSIPTLAANQSITTLPLAGLNGEYEKNLTEKTSFVIGLSYFSYADEKNQAVAYGMNIGEKWYFNQAQNGGYFGINTGYSIIYNIPEKAESQNGISLQITPLLGYKKITSSGYTYDLGISYSLAGVFGDQNPQMRGGLGIKLGFGYGW